MLGCLRSTTEYRSLSAQRTLDISLQVRKSYIELYMDINRSRWVRLVVIIEDLCVLNMSASFPSLVFLYL